jgi:hypothetical protein
LQSQTVGDGKNSHNNSGRMSSNVLQPGKTPRSALANKTKGRKMQRNTPTIKPQSALPDPQALRWYNKVHVILRYVHHSRTHHE